VTVSNVFGRIVTGAMVERAVVDFLTAPDATTEGTWLATALGEIERIEGLTPGQIETPKGVVTSSDFEKWPEDQLPVILVICPGLVRPPERKGRGALTMTWGVGVAGIVGDTTPESSRLMGQVYAAAISLAINTHRSLGGFGQAVQLDERYDDLDFGDGRTLGAGRCVFEVSVEDARPTHGGPLAPLPNPAVDPGPWPDVTETLIDVELKPMTEAVHS
jgi:hypothetical protein